ncbi:hypothetical protein [Gordonia sp. SL306]|uniref:hypothetical protein n=1 Tax=Gordonia sp. SL306 TaxID=2995145 RepID=UPI00226FADE2|nr:hypothetical protein [Gordonia sp. SL306]WAC57506.1 hypothetical protein OVA31_09875 [Gordonia sp. SL306]
MTALLNAGRPFTGVEREVLENTAEHRLIGDVARHACHADILVEQIRARDVRCDE